jgi:hypothetical protein
MTTTPAGAAAALIAAWMSAGGGTAAAQNSLALPQMGAEKGTAAARLRVRLQLEVSFSAVIARFRRAMTAENVTSN